MLKVKQLGMRVRDEALATLGERMDGGLLIVNPTSFTRHDLLFVAEEKWTGGTTTGRTQAVAGGYLLDVGALPPYSVTPWMGLSAISGTLPAPTLLPTGGDVPGPVFAAPALLENDFLRVELNGDGEIERIYDKKNGREVLPPGEIGNQFQAFEDRPRAFDAWEIDNYYDDRIWFADAADSVRVVENGPLRATLEITRQLLNSEIRQRISLAYNSPRLDFATDVDWRERHVLLKVAFPVDVLSSVATYEIQWGNVERPTHRNTSWDWARFETCAQKWVDLSEGDYGVSLLNDCKYGHDIHDNVMRLTLLRGPTDPDPEADLGRHTFSYSLWPHAGSWDEGTQSEAYALNDPPFVAGGDQEALSSMELPLSFQESFVAVDRPNVVIETVKLAEDGDGVIERLYESQRRRGQFSVKCAFPVAGAWRTNLLEENQEPLLIEGQKVTASIRPYQIMTLRLRPGDEPGQLPVEE